MSTSQGESRKEKEMVVPRLFDLSMGQGRPLRNAHYSKRNRVSGAALSALMQRVPGYLTSFVHHSYNFLAHRVSTTCT